MVRLNRRNGATSPLGRYRCAIPDTSGVTRSVYVNIVAVSVHASFADLVNVRTGEALPVVTCPVVTNPANGGVLSLSRAVGGLATYTCNPGYTLSGSSRRVCLMSSGVEMHLLANEVCLHCLWYFMLFYPLTHFIAHSANIM